MLSARAKHQPARCTVVENVRYVVNSLTDVIRSLVVCLSTHISWHQLAEFVPRPTLTPCTLASIPVAARQPQCSHLLLLTFFQVRFLRPRYTEYIRLDFEVGLHLFNRLFVKSDPCPTLTPQVGVSFQLVSSHQDPNLCFPLVPYAQVFFSQQLGKSIRALSVRSLSTHPHNIASGGWSLVLMTVCL